MPKLVPAFGTLMMVGFLELKKNYDFNIICYKRGIMYLYMSAAEERRGCGNYIYYYYIIIIKTDNIYKNEVQEIG